MTIATPSAKSHERVTGRWVRDLEIHNSRERAVYYAKVAIGTPVPWLLWAFACLCFLSRAGVEIAAWGAAALTALYILADRFSSSREFSFFRIGGDFFLLGYLLVGVISALSAGSLAEGVATLGAARWVILFYAISYCWELFPGLNRLYGLIVVSATAASVYGLWQHFSGVDLLAGTELASAPVPHAVFFVPISFFNTPEIYGTLIAMILPFPAAAYLLDERRDARLQRWSILLFCLFLSLSVFWTYRPGMWLAGLVGMLVTILMQARHSLKLILCLAVLIGTVALISYHSPDEMLSNVQTSEDARAARQRTQINTQVKLWEENPWMGVGHQAQVAADYDPGTGNAYFQILAQAGVLGAGCYFLFLLGYLLSTYRIFNEIPQSHYWHRVLIVGGLGSQIAFHVAGLYWSTLSEALAMNLFVLILASISYLSEHYSRGLVPDDSSL